eukprot:scaffold130164_cov25-Cyclotella_meneghiniana.AAC.2
MKLWYHTRRMTNAVSNDAVNAMSVFYSSGVLLTFHYWHCLSPGRTLAVGFEFRIQNLKSTPIRGSSTSTGFRCCCWGDVDLNSLYTIYTAIKCSFLSNSDIRSQINAWLWVGFERDKNR